jgi:hypothetical protein
VSADPDATARKIEGRRLSVLRRGWGRWLLEPTPCTESGGIPEVLDEQSIERGAERHRVVNRWVEQGGDLPWEPS